MGREVGRAPLLGHVVADRLDLDDLAVGVEEGAVGPLVPAQRSVERDALGRRASGPWRPPVNERSRSSIGPRSDAGRRSTNGHAVDIVVAAEELAERPVRERERRVGPVPAHELGLVVDDARGTAPRSRADAARSNAGPPPPRVRSVMSRDVTTMPLTDGSSSRLLATSSAYIHEPSPFWRRISIGRNSPGSSSEPVQRFDDPVPVVGVDGLEHAAIRRPPAGRVAVHALRARARVEQPSFGIDHRDDVGDVRDERLQPLLRRARSCSRPRPDR